MFELLIGFHSYFLSLPVFEDVLNNRLPFLLSAGIKLFDAVTLALMVTDVNFH